MQKSFGSMAFSLALIIVLSACNQPVKGRNGQVYKNAAEYNNYIIERQSVIMKDIAGFVRISNTSLDSANQALDTYLPELDRIITEIQDMPAYKGDSSLRNTAVNLFSFYRKLFIQDYKQLILYWREHGRQTREGIDETKRVIDKITLEEETYDKSFHNTQKDFAERNNMKIKEAE
jgi:hypothetical protein